MEHSFMRNSKIKLLFSVVLFLVFVGLITWAVAYPFDRIFSKNNNFDVLVVGASETQWGIDPEIIEQETGLKAVLLATSGSSIEQRYTMLESHIRDKSLKLVILEVSKFSLTSDMDDKDIEQRVLYFSRVDGLWNKLTAAVREFSFEDDEYDRLYAEILYEGIKSWDSIFNGTYNEVIARRGYDPQNSYSQLLTEEEARATYREGWLSTDPNKENAEALCNLINLCKENNVPVIMITMPLSEHYLWQYGGWDTARENILELLEGQDITYYDFNLMKERQKYLSDEVSYRDMEHLGDEGAKSFSKVLSKTITAYLNGENGWEFYDWYGEAISNCIYAEYLPG